MRIDGYYNREPIGLSDNPEETTFSFDYATIPLVWLQMKFFLLCMARRVHKMFTKKISTRLLTVLTISVILHIEQRKGNKKKSSKSGVENVDNTQE